MGMFEDVKAMEPFESAEMKALKKRLAIMSVNFENALSHIEKLNTENAKNEESFRKKIGNLERENASLKRSFSIVMEELKKEKKSKAAITKNRNFWRKEVMAEAVLRRLAEEELEKIKETSTIPSTRIILPGEKTSLAMAAKIVPAIGK